MKIMTRQQAKDAGLSRYFTGKPCKHGHVAERRMSDGCVVCADIYARAWQKAHPEYVKQKSRSYHAENRELKNQKSRAWQKENLEKHKAATSAWRLRNQDRVKATKAAWRKSKADQVNAAQILRYVHKKQRTPLWSDADAVRLIYRAAQIARVTWPDADVEVDHIIPLRGLRVSGLHLHTNLRIVTGTTNRTKSFHFEGELR